MAISLTDQLIEQAEHLITYRRPKHPRQADLRRAVSACYYGIFHLICSDVADFFAQRSQRGQPTHTLVFRSLDHGQLRRMCTAIQSPRPDTSITALFPKRGFSSELIEFAAITVELQDARIRADYDPASIYSVADARAATQSAREAIKLYKTVSSVTPAADRSAFLALLMFKRR